MRWNLAKFLQNRVNWLRRTPERAVYQAYQSAVKIKKIEDEFFDGQPIADTAGYSANAYSLFRLQLQRNLQNIRLRLAEYQVSATLPFTLTSGGVIKVNQPLKTPEENPPLLQQLAFIDFILKRYAVSPKVENAVNSEPVKLLDDSLTQNQENPHRFTLLSPSTAEKKRNTASPTIVPIEKTIIPGSFFRAFERIRRTVTNDYFGYERDFVDELRQSRKRSTLALRYLSLLTLIFIGTQVLTKNLVFSPIIDTLFPPSDQKINFSLALQEQAFMEYRLVRDRTEFQNLVNELNATANAQETKAELSKELKRILITYNQRSLEGLKNLGADLLAVCALYITLISTRKQLALVKEFIDEILYSLNDSAKAFMIIVATDTFVGFHSSDGWDALFFVIFSHFGLPENPILTKTFIATVPVFLDGLFKFWIFQYLRQSSPSTAAIFSEMNQ